MSIYLVFVVENLAASGLKTGKGRRQKAKEVGKWGSREVGGVDKGIWIIFPFSLFPFSPFPFPLVSPAPLPSPKVREFWLRDVAEIIELLSIQATISFTKAGLRISSTK